MKSGLKRKLKELYSFFKDEYKEKIEYIIKIPFVQNETDLHDSVQNILKKYNINIDSDLKEYYENVYFLFEGLYRNVTEHDPKKNNFIKMFVNDIIPLLEVYYKILKNNYNNYSRENTSPSLGWFLSYLLRVYSNLGESVYKEVVRDILDFLINADSMYEFTIISGYPFLCSICKPYYRQCVEMYKDKIFYKNINIVILLDLLYRKYLGKSMSRDEFASSLHNFKQMCRKTNNSSEVDVNNFIVYLYVNTYNEIFHNINVEELFRMLMYINYSNNFCFRNEEDIFWYLNPEILDIFIDTMIDIDRNNFNILEEKSATNVDMSNIVCNIVLFDVIVDEIRKNRRNDILFKTSDRFSFIEKYLDIFSKYKYIPSFIKVFIYSLNYCTVFDSVMSYLNSNSEYMYDYRLCDIYLTNSGILYNIMSSKKFSEFYSDFNICLKYRRRHKYFSDYWIMFRNFMKCMEIVEYKNRDVRFEDFILFDNNWDDSELIVDDFPLITCFVVLPMLAVENNMNNVKYLGKMLNNVHKIIFEGKMGSNFKNINCCTFGIIENNKELFEKFCLTNVHYSGYSDEIVNCLIFICLIYYFGINLIDDCILPDKLKLIFDMNSKELSKNIFNILYILYNNLTSKDLERTTNFLINMYRSL